MICIPGTILKKQLNLFICININTQRQGVKMAEFHGISIDKNVIASFCKKNGIRKLSLFGSILRDDFGPDSDIDVIVEFEEGRKIGYFELFDIEENLSQLYGGRKVDVRTPADLSRYFRKEVMNKAVIQYAS